MLYNKVSQPYMCVYTHTHTHTHALLFSPPAIPSHPIPLCPHRAPGHRAGLSALWSRFPLAICFTLGCMYTSVPISKLSPPPCTPSACPHLRSLSLIPLTLASKTAAGKAPRHASLQSNLCFCLFPCFLTVEIVCHVSGFCDVWKLFLGQDQSWQSPATEKEAPRYTWKDRLAQDVRSPGVETWRVKLPCPGFLTAHAGQSRVQKSRDCLKGAVKWSMKRALCFPQNKQCIHSSLLYRIRLLLPAPGLSPWSQP